MFISGSSGLLVWLGYFSVNATGPKLNTTHPCVSPGLHIHAMHLSPSSRGHLPSSLIPSSHLTIFCNAARSPLSSSTELSRYPYSKAKDSTRISRSYTKSYLPYRWKGVSSFLGFGYLIPGCITRVELSFSKRSRFLLLSSVESVHGWGLVLRHHFVHTYIFPLGSFGIPVGHFIHTCGT